MITIKQMEALCAIARLGSFERAAARLQTTQSTVSKRIQELESTFNGQLFDRTRRSARLTPKGEAILALGAEILVLRDRVVKIGVGHEQTPRRLRLGITELTALTWLPRLVAEIRKVYPNVTLEPEINKSTVLFERLENGSLDLIISAETRQAAQLTAVPLVPVENCLMCSPGLLPTTRVLPVAELSKYTLITQGNLTASGARLDKWLRSNSVNLEKVVITNSLVVVAGLTLSGLGISCLPRSYFRDSVAAGRLKIIRTSPSVPKLAYFAFYRNDRTFEFNARIAEMCSQLCDFSMRCY